MEFGSRSPKNSYDVQQPFLLPSDASPTKPTISRITWRRKTLFSSSKDRLKYCVTFVLFLLAVMLLILMIGFLKLPRNSDYHTKNQILMYNQDESTRKFSTSRFLNELNLKPNNSDNRNAVHNENENRNIISTTTTTTTIAPTTTTVAEPTNTEDDTTTDLSEEKLNKDCLYYYMDGSSTGIYNIVKGDTKIRVFCDMDSENGGWTIIQRRLNKNERFHNRGWNDYVHGFGELNGNFWLGLENIYKLAPISSDYSTLRIELYGDTCEGSKCLQYPSGYWFAEYNFKLGDTNSGYVLDISPPLRGNLSTPGDVNDGLFSMNNGRKFTTIDRDQDEQPEFNCAQFRNFGPWWHGSCTSVSLNGFYGDRKPVARYLMWMIHDKSMQRYPIHPKKVIMMLKPKTTYK